MRMYLISDNIDTYTGMRLSGVEGVVVHEREELEEALSFVTGQPDIGIVLLTEKLGRDFPELVNRPGWGNWSRWICFGTGWIYFGIICKMER